MYKKTELASSITIIVGEIIPKTMKIRISKIITVLKRPEKLPKNPNKKIILEDLKTVKMATAIIVKELPIEAQIRIILGVLKTVKKQMILAIDFNILVKINLSAQIKELTIEA